MCPQIFSQSNLNNIWIWETLLSNMFLRLFIPIIDYSSYISKTPPLFEMKFSYLCFFDTNIYICIGLKQLNGSKNQRYILFPFNDA